jgi:hypothetical protein
MMGRTSDTTRTAVATSTTTNKAASVAVPNRRACTIATSSAVSDLGTFRQMQQIIQQEGITGLWKGNLTRMVKVAPA